MQSTFFRSIFIFLFTLVLCACGSERDTPFNPGNSNNSSSAASIGAAVTITEIARYNDTEPAQPAHVETTNKQIYVINTEKEFLEYWDIYKNDIVEPTDLDFEEIQVVILDLGNIGNCPQKTNYRNVKAYEYSDNTVLVSFNFREAGTSASSVSSSSSSSSSSCSDPIELAKKRPFYFYSVESRKKILVEEKVTYE